MSSRTCMATTTFWNLPEEAKKYFEKNSDIHLLVCGGGKKRLESLGDKWMEEHCIPDDAFKDNISHLNSSLNEWTTLYLVRKNLRVLPAVPATANIGHCHFRRFFKREDLEEIDTVDGIVAKNMPLGVCGFSCDVKKQYELLHLSRDFIILENLLRQTSFWNEDSWNEWCKLRFLYAPCNVWLLKRECFNMMMDDLLPVMLKLRELIDVAGRDDYQKRACAFLGERLVSYWLWSSDFRLIEKPLVEMKEWKPEGATDKRGMYNGVFIGDRCLPRIQEWALNNMMMKTQHREK